MKICNYCNSKFNVSEDKCPNCGANESAYFCDNCGAIFTSKFCPDCGSRALPNSKVCPQCGLEYASPACPNCGYNDQKEEKGENKNSSSKPQYEKQLSPDVSLAKGNVFGDKSSDASTQSTGGIIKIVSSTWFLVIMLLLTPILSIIVTWKYHSRYKLLYRVLLTTIALIFAYIRYGN